MIKNIIIYLMVFVSLCIAQESAFNNVKGLFEDFEYERVIQSSNELVNNKEYPDSLRIELHMMRAISFFFFGNEDRVKQNFQSILEISNGFTLDASKISSLTWRQFNPRLVALFNEVRTEYLKKNPIEAANPEDVAQIIRFAEEKEQKLRYAFLKNTVLPGWGNFDLNKNTKGWITSALSSLNIVAMLYFIIDTNQKETNYLNETNKSNIGEKYSSYNSAFQTRNFLIGSFLAMWLYNQIDLLFFSKEDSNPMQNSQTMLLPAIEPNRFCFALKISL